MVCGVRSIAGIRLYETLEESYCRQKCRQNEVHLVECSMKVKFTDTLTLKS